MLELVIGNRNHSSCSLRAEPEVIEAEEVGADA